MVATSLDRIHVWEKSVNLGGGGEGRGWVGGGVLSVFVLELLCKHVFLWVCAFPCLRVSLSVSRYLCHGDILTIACSHCPCSVIGVYTLMPPLFFFFSPCPPPL